MKTLLNRIVSNKHVCGYQAWRNTKHTNLAFEHRHATVRTLFNKFPQMTFDGWKQNSGLFLVPELKSPEGFLKAKVSYAISNRYRFNGWCCQCCNITESRIRLSKEDGSFWIKSLKLNQGSKRSHCLMKYQIHYAGKAQLSSSCSVQNMPFVFYVIFYSFFSIHSTWFTWLSNCFMLLLEWQT